MSENTKEHLKDLLESFDTAMLITRSGEREHARPMAVAKIETQGDTHLIWFVTSRDAPKTDEIRKDTRVSATFQSDRRFIALSGSAELVTDRSKIQELWKPAWKVWFPNGKDDPNLELIQVTVTDAEFWDNAGTRGIRYVFEAAKALVSHKQPGGMAGLHGRVKDHRVVPEGGGASKATNDGQPVSQRH